MSSDSPEFAQADAAARYVLKKTKLRPKVALVLGSGLGAFADEFAAATRIPYAKIPKFPTSTAIGHAGQLVLGVVEGIEVVGMQGEFICMRDTRYKMWRFPCAYLRGWE